MFRYFRIFLKVVCAAPKELRITIGIEIRTIGNTVLLSNKGTWRTKKVCFHYFIYQFLLHVQLIFQKS